MPLRRRLTLALGDYVFYGNKPYRVNPYGPTDDGWVWIRHPDWDGYSLTNASNPAFYPGETINYVHETQLIKARKNSDGTYSPVA